MTVLHRNVAATRVFGRRVVLVVALVLLLLHRRLTALNSARCLLSALMLIITTVLMLVIWLLSKLVHLIATSVQVALLEGCWIVIARVDSVILSDFIGRTEFLLRCADSHAWTLYFLLDRSFITAKNVQITISSWRLLHLYG